MNNKKERGVSEGFTLIEIVIVSTIIIIISGIMFANFRVSSKNTAARHQVSATIVADIRKTQSWALAGTTSGGLDVCGYGINYTGDGKTYIIFKKTAACAPKKFQGDSVIETKIVANINFVLGWSQQSGVYSDIYFEPPDPKTYIDGKTLEINEAEDIAEICVRPVGNFCNNIADCGRTDIGAPADCSETTKISVGASGRINVTN
jgi:type II secretory pathway pseudopilin PulG